MNNSHDRFGNRLKMQDDVRGLRTCYVYDIDWDRALNQWRSGMYYTPREPIGAACATNNALLLLRRKAP